jgi:hypothetical protein
MPTNNDIIVCTNSRMSVQLNLLRTGSLLFSTMSHFLYKVFFFSTATSFLWMSIVCWNDIAQTCRWKMEKRTRNGRQWEHQKHWCPTFPFAQSDMHITAISRCDHAVSNIQCESIEKRGSSGTCLPCHGSSYTKTRMMRFLDWDHGETSQIPQVRRASTCS